METLAKIKDLHRDALNKYEKYLKVEHELEKEISNSANGFLDKTKIDSLEKAKNDWTKADNDFLDFLDKSQLG